MGDGGAGTQGVRTLPGHQGYHAATHKNHPPVFFRDHGHCEKAILCVGFTLIRCDLYLSIFAPKRLMILLGVSTVTASNTGPLPQR